MSKMTLFTNRFYLDSNRFVVRTGEGFVPCETEKTFLQSFDSLTDVTVLQRDHKKRKTNRLNIKF